MIINYCGFSYLPHSGTFSALVDSRNENFYHISCLKSLMDLSHINLHGIHKILSHQHFSLYLCTFLSIALSQACSIVRQQGPGIELSKGLCNAGRTHWDRIQKWGWHKLALETLNICWQEANKLNPNDLDETISSDSDLSKTWDFPFNIRQAHVLPTSHRLHSFSHAELPKPSMESGAPILGNT
jgi:hypothetical protein